MKWLWCIWIHQFFPLAIWNGKNFKTVSLWNRGRTIQCTKCGLRHDISD
jgi:hypothetical protein